MNTIHLHQLLPQVFAERTDIRSDIWNRDITLQRGKLYLVEAQSGTGKTSLCSYLYGQRSDYQGQITFDDTDIRTLTPSRWDHLRQHSLAILFQEMRLFPELTALENVQIKNRLTHFKTQEQIEEMFCRLHIHDKLNTPAAIMSLGQQQRVALIRAFCQPFHFLLADEPISHLDEDNAQLMAQLILSEARAQSAALILTSIGKHPNLPYDNHLRL